MKRLKVWVPLDPVAKERPRAVRIPRGRACPACGQAPTIVKIHPGTKTAKFEEQIAFVIAGAARRAGFTSPMVGPLAVTLDFVVHRPASLPKCGNREWRELGHEPVPKDAWKTGARVPAPVRPDIDNFVKSVLDGMNGANVWLDDGQVVSLSARKWYAAVDEAPGIQVLVGPA